MNKYGVKEDPTVLGRENQKNQKRDIRHNAGVLSQAHEEYR